MRVLLFTGKGGVGKTTTAAATALRCADAGLRTVVLSTDPAHSLADAYALDLGDRPVEVAPGLWGQQLDTQARMEDTWVEIQAWLLQVFEWAGVAAIEAEELSVIPGLDELFALSDRLLVMAKGRLSPSVATGDASVTQIGVWRSGLWDEAAVAAAHVAVEA